jgi:uncharacterized protein with HEPN domain
MSEQVLRAGLEFILASVELIEQRFSNIQTPDDFVLSDNGKLCYDGILMRFQSIGEKIKSIQQKEPLLLKAKSEIEWNKIIRLRDFISHHYEQLSHEIIFDACKYDVPVLKKAVEELIAGLNK